MRNHQSHVSNPAAPEDGYDDVRSAASSSDSSHHPPTPPFAREKMMVMAARSPLVSAENHPALGGQHQQQQPSAQHQQQQLHPQQQPQPQPQPGMRTGHPSHANSPSARRNSRSETRARAPYLSAAGAPRTLSDYPSARPPPASRATATVPQRQLSNSAAASSSSSRGSRAVNRWIGMAREGEAEREEARVSADGGGGGAAAAAAAAAAAIAAPDHDDDQTENGDPATAGSLLAATADKKRRYPRTRRGGYAPAHLRQQFCSIDHPRDNPDGEPPDDNKAEKGSLLSRLLGLRPKPRPKKKRQAASLLSSSSLGDREGGERRGGRDGAEREDEADKPEEEDPKWRGWEIRATYQPALISGPDGAPSRDSTAVSPHIEFRLRARRDVTLRELIVWGVAWRPRRRGRDSFGTYDGCDRHPDRALGRWGRMAERRAVYGNAISTGATKPKGGAGAKRGRWTARVSVVHEDAAWLEKVNPAALVKLEDANTIEIYDLSGEMCFVLDAHTNQYWVLNDAIPEDKGQWIGDNVWNVVHGYDEEA